MTTSTDEPGLGRKKECKKFFDDYQVVNMYECLLCLINIKYRVMYSRMHNQILFISFLSYVGTLWINRVVVETLLSLEKKIPVSFY